MHVETVDTSRDFLLSRAIFIADTKREKRDAK